MDTRLSVVVHRDCLLLCTETEGAVSRPPVRRQKRRNKSTSSQDHSGDVAMPEDNG